MNNTDEVSPMNIKITNTISQYIPIIIHNKHTNKISQQRAMKICYFWRLDAFIYAFLVVIKA